MRHSLLEPSSPPRHTAWPPTPAAGRAVGGFHRSVCSFCVTLGRYFTPGLVRGGYHTRRGCMALRPSPLWSRGMCQPFRDNSRQNLVSNCWLQPAHGLWVCGQLKRHQLPTYPQPLRRLGFVDPNLLGQPRRLGFTKNEALWMGCIGSLKYLLALFSNGFSLAMVNICRGHEP